MCTSNPRLTDYQNCIVHATCSVSLQLKYSANSIMFCNSKEYINAVEQVVKSLEDGLHLYPCSYFSGIEVSTGPFLLMRVN